MVSGQEKKFCQQYIKRGLKQNLLRMFEHPVRKSSICKTTSGLKKLCKL